MIPAQAVEAAEEAVIDAMIKHGPDGHIDGYQEIARAALEAAAPHIRAQAWDEGVQAQKDWTWNDDMDPLTNPYRTAK